MNPHQVAELFEILLIILGTGMLAYSPVMRGIADRIRYGKLSPPGSEQDTQRVDDISAEVHAMRTQLQETQDRLEFTERMLAKERSRGALRGGEND